MGGCVGGTEVQRIRERRAGITRRTANGAQRAEPRSRRSVAPAPAGRGIQGLDVSWGGGKARGILSGREGVGVEAPAREYGQSECGGEGSGGGGGMAAAPPRLRSTRELICGFSVAA